MKPRKEKSVFREYAESILLAIILAFIMRQFVVQAFKIPSGSMEETLLIGDHILVNKFLYSFTSPQRFDVIVFRYPWDDGRDFIKRIVGLPGDRVEMRNRRMFINGQRLIEPYVQYTSMGLRDRDFGPVVVPKKGDTIEVHHDRRVYLNGEQLSIPPGPFYPQDRGAPMDGFEVFYGALFPPGTDFSQTTVPVTVQHDYYFALGDNRDNSKDSRYWGFVRRPRIKGKAFFIYWSWNRHGDFVQHVRWNRLGRLLELAPSGSFAAGH